MKTGRPSMNFVETLPQELVLLIIQCLPIEDRARCCLVDRAWNRLTGMADLGSVLELRPKEVRPPLLAPKALLSRSQEY